MQIRAAVYSIRRRL